MGTAFSKTQSGVSWRKVVFVVLATLWICSLRAPQAWAQSAELLASQQALKDKQYDEVIRLNTAAIISGKLGQELDDAYYARAVAYRSKGDYALAIADLDKAAVLSPEAGFIFGERAITYFALGDFEKSAADYDREIQLIKPQALDLLWRHVARSRAGRRMTPEFAGETVGVDRQEWPGIIVELFLGISTPDDVSVAAIEGGADMRLGRLCAADFFVGQYWILQEKPLNARDLLEQAVGDCAEGSETHTAAKAELARLGRTPLVPPEPPPGSTPELTDLDVERAPMPAFDTSVPFDWSSVSGIDTVFAPVAYQFKVLFANSGNVFFYWGAVVAVLAMALWWLARPVLVWLARHLVGPLARVARYAGALVGKMTIVAAAIFMTALGGWLAIVERDWLNGASLLVGFGFLTAMIVRHFLRARRASKDEEADFTADQYAEAYDFNESL